MANQCSSYKCVLPVVPSPESPWFCHIYCDGSVEKLELKALKESVKEMGNLQDSGKKAPL